MTAYTLEDFSQVRQYSENGTDKGQGKLKATGEWVDFTRLQDGTLLLSSIHPRDLPIFLGTYQVTESDLSKFVSDDKILAIQDPGPVTITTIPQFTELSQDAALKRLANGDALYAPVENGFAFEALNDVDDFNRKIGAAYREAVEARGSEFVQYVAPSTDAQFISQDSDSEDEPELEVAKIEIGTIGVAGSIEIPADIYEQAVREVEAEDWEYRRTNHKD